MAVAMAVWNKQSVFSYFRLDLYSSEVQLFSRDVMWIMWDYQYTNEHDEGVTIDTQQN